MLPIENYLWSLPGLFSKLSLCLLRRSLVHQRSNFDEFFHNRPQRLPGEPLLFSFRVSSVFTVNHIQTNAVLANFQCRRKKIETKWTHQETVLFRQRIYFLFAFHFPSKLRTALCYLEDE